VNVGGINEFNDRKGKPWTNKTPRNAYDFWEKTNEWFQTWHGDNCALKVQSVKVYAV
jgi:hypothetical protein